MSSDIHTQQVIQNRKDSYIPQVSVADFYERIQKPNDLLLLDVRNDEDYKAWKIESRWSPETMHVFYGDIIENEQILTGRIPPGREIIVLCGKGGASEYVASVLRQNFGITATNLSQGMAGWGNFYHIQPVVEKEAYQIYQVSRFARGCLSYILISRGQAVVIDPLRHIEYYVEFLAARQAQLRYILDTHAHADHISGGPALSRHLRAPYYLHPYDAIHPIDFLPARIPYEHLSGGQSFSVGDLTLNVVHTPGHTLGQVNFYVTSSEGEGFLFSGDNIFIQSFGRPDLGGQGQAWAPLVYETVFQKIKKIIPASTLMLPGHFAQPQEADEQGLFAQRMSEIWSQNLDLQTTEQDQFVRFVLDHLPQLPQQYLEIKRVNIGLVNPDEETASELELGKNVCALSTAY